MLSEAADFQLTKEYCDSVNSSQEAARNDYISWLSVSRADFHANTFTKFIQDIATAADVPKQKWEKITKNCTLQKRDRIWSRGGEQRAAWLGLPQC